MRGQCTHGNCVKWPLDVEMRFVFNHNLNPLAIMGHCDNEPPGLGSGVPGPVAPLPTGRGKPTDTSYDHSLNIGLTPQSLRLTRDNEHVFNPFTAPTAAVDQFLPFTHDLKTRIVWKWD